MSRLMRDGTVESVSRDQISGANRDREKNIFPAQLTTSRIGNLTRLIYTTRYAISHDHTEVYTVLFTEPGSDLRFGPTSCFRVFSACLFLCVTRHF